MPHTHKWYGIGSRTRGWIHKRHVVILACECGRQFEAEMK
jgi:hypothetical protein